ncbi:MAG: (Fe-S)-binding protein [Gemmataceae bacterium]
MSAMTEATRTALPTVPTPKHDAGIPYELYLDCVHCGLCTAACPTYLELGDENDSPRGRIYLMRSVTDGRIDLTPEVQHHLELCLDCRACESACPSGVQYGRLIEPFRTHMAKTGQTQTKLGWMKRTLLFGITPYAWRTRMALLPARWMQWTGLDWLIRKTGLTWLMPKFFRQLHDMLPRLKPHYGQLPEILPPEGEKRARVALFTGCAGDAFYPQTNVATAKVLQKNGCEVWIPRSQVCCGALHHHSAREEPAVDFARQNCQTFAGDGLEKLQEVDAIIVNAAGCGAMLKEYNYLLHNTSDAKTGEALAKKVRDVSEFLMELGPVNPEHPIPIKATYHDACHLCHGQQIRKEPRQLLGLIPEMELVPLDETELCCGAAGSYNLTQPDMADKLGRRKAEHITATQADAVFTANVGCLLQIGRYLREDKPNLWVAHPIDVLWASYSGDIPKEVLQITQGTTEA